jgi:hypothetical protein
MAAKYSALLRGGYSQGLVRYFWGAGAGFECKKGRR